jgi:hypothetical protein
VVDLAEDLWGKIPGKRRKPKSYHDQRYRIRKLRNMAEAVCTMGKLDTSPGPLFHKRLRDLIASGVNPQIDIGNREAWIQWESWARDEIRRIRHNTQVERRAFLGDRWRKKESMFYMSAGNKRFNERYLNPQPKHVLDSVLKG